MSRVVVCDMCKATRDEDCCQVGPSPDRERALRTRAEEAERLLAEAREVLRSVEVIELDEGGWFCPSCSFGTDALERPSVVDHAHDCRLAKVLVDL